VSYSAALSSATNEALRDHLVREDGQEDLCFALWRPSTGSERTSALVSQPILPLPGERNVHGNVSFEGQYLVRAAGLAAEASAGLALLHTHPGGRGWQGMSADDVHAEQTNAPRVRALTGLPLLGLTLAGRDGGWSARLWEKVAPREYERRDCENVRVVGSELRLTFHPQLRPPPAFREELTRTISAWGEDAQANLARLRVGVVGLGSVGSIVAESLARMGIAHIRLLDFDAIETLNLDRVLNARASQVGAAKVIAAAEALRSSATAASPRIDALEWSVVEPEGFAAALDCDVLFSCVDRPWPRAVLNLIAYAHLIPVVDGGIVVSRTRRGRMRGADWRAHIAAPGRRCLECLGQYDPASVALEREGRLDDPSYIEHLSDDDPLRRNENVFVFSVGCAGLELSQFVSMVIAPGRIADVGAQMYHLSNGELDNDYRICEAGCLYSEQLVANGDRTGTVVTSRHEVAEQARAGRGAKIETRDPWVARLRRRLRRRG
jgi:molybdopterin-synthase adenylyltransferase